jgi:hypothetical protein
VYVAAIVYLAVWHRLLIGLLRQNHNGTRDQFESRLAGMTDQDKAALNQSLNAWLTSTTTSSARGGNTFHVDATLSSGRSTAEVRVSFDRSRAATANRCNREPPPHFRSRSVRAALSMAEATSVTEALPFRDR